MFKLLSPRLETVDPVQVECQELVWIYPYIASMLILRFTSRRGRVLKEQLSLKCFLQGVTRRNERTDGNENASHLTRETTSLARQTVVIQLLFEEDAIYSSATFKKRKGKRQKPMLPVQVTFNQVNLNETVSNSSQAERVSNE